eukprot:9078249-Pyramimonas_sp.AAC.1
MTGHVRVYNFSGTAHNPIITALPRAHTSAAAKGDVQSLLERGCPLAPTTAPPSSTSVPTTSPRAAIQHAVEAMQV